MEINDDLLKLLDRISNGEATEEEISEYNRWCHAFQSKGMPVPNIEEIKAGMLTEIKKQIHYDSKIYRLRSWTKTAVAASVILVLIFGGYYFAHRQHPKQMAEIQLKDVAPGGNKAILTLANGQTIVLDSVPSGQLASQGNIKITKIDSGLLAYAKVSSSKSSRISATSQYNTLSTPRGGQYRLILPDGTKVWLNASSSIRYPTAFTGKERRVAITGEVYMEVARDAVHPFIVSTRYSDITVLGTHFNIMAYEDEPAVNTTLLEGSVKVSLPGKQAATVIKRGEQASVGNGSDAIEVKKVNAVSVAAWIYGLLSLKDCSVREFMDQLSRWYDVDIEYAGTVPQQRFGGMINRNAPLSDVLSALNEGGIRTKLEGKKIVVF